MRLPAFVCVALAACALEPLETRVPGLEALPPATGCANGLTITPANAHAERGSTLKFSASAGSGVYRFTLLSGHGGLSTQTGVLALDDGHSASETVRVEDTVCARYVDATITVFDTLKVWPSALTVGPNKQLALITSGGSGSFAFELAHNESGGTLAGASYMTGPNAPARDDLIVRDLLTNKAQFVVLQVEVGAEFSIQPAHAIIPVGATFIVRSDGLSGALTLTSSAPSVVSFDGERLIGNAAGTATVSVYDRALNETRVLAVSVASSQRASLPRSNDGSVSGQLLGGVHALGDLNGDGREEFMVNEPGLNLTGHRSGGVHVYYPDGSDGFTLDTFAGDARLVEAGWSALVTDADNDGRRDLLIGAALQTTLQPSDGAVYVHKGQADGHFAQKRTLLTIGRYSARFGSALASCDFNADGLSDFAVGAALDTDPSLSTPASWQGSISVFLGEQGKLPIQPAQTLFGKLPSGGELIDTAGLQLGQKLSAGDYDGDGYCDLAAASYSYDGSRGVVVVYRGSAVGLSLVPSRVIAGSDATGGLAFGFSLLSQDFNGDGKSELAIGAVSASKLYIVTGAPMPAPPLLIENAANLGWLVIGTPTEGFGAHVSSADVDRDGVDDLLVGALAANVPGTSAAGAVRLFLGRPGLLPHATAARQYSGDQYDGLFGVGVAAIDIDGAGEPELVIYAPAHSSLGPRAGRPFVLSSANESLATPLPFPGSASGQEFGNALAITPDLTGDGIEDLVASAPYANRTEGAVFIYPGSASGFALDPSITLPAVGQYFGKDLVYAGAFSNDTRRYLGVVSQLAPRPTNASLSADPAYELEANCGDAAINGYDDAAVYYNQGRLALYGANVGSALSQIPDFVYFGGTDSPGNAAQLWRASTGFDWNGDGKDDIAVSSPVGTGHVAIILGGRARTTGKTRVICNPDVYVKGVFPSAGYGFGFAIAGLGDIWPSDGASRGALAVGSMNESLAIAPYTLNRGAIFVLRKAGLGSEPEAVLLAGERIGSQLGAMLAKIPEGALSPLPALAAAAPQYERGNVAEGRLFIVPGAAIAPLPWRSFSALPKNASMYVGCDFFVEQSGGKNGFGRLDLWSPVHVSGFGLGLASAPGTPPLLAIGSPFGRVNGRLLSGGVYVHSLIANAPLGPGLASATYAEVAGEDTPSGSQLGQRIAVGTLLGKRVLAVGAPRGLGAAPDAGSLYTVFLE
jgi:hypothetical protein